MEIYLVVEVGSFWWDSLDRHVNILGTGLFNHASIDTKKRPHGFQVMVCRTLQPHGRHMFTCRSIDQHLFPK
jgi:hypothetical protein